MAQSQVSSPTSSTRRFSPPFAFEQGQHLALLGQTGSGKSTLLAQLTTVRRYDIVIRTKPDNVKYPDHLIVRKAAEMKRVTNEKIVVAPKYADQREQIGAVLEQVWKDGSWLISIDELFYVTEKLKLDEPVERLLTQGRSKKISVICGMQRPARISRFAISESTHVVAFYLEGRDRKIVKEAGSELLAEAVESLDRFEFAWLFRPTRQVWIGRIQDLGGQP